MREANLLDKLIEYFQKLSKELEARMKKYKVEGTKPTDKASTPAKPKVRSGKATDGVGQNREVKEIDSKNAIDSENNPYVEEKKPFSMEKSRWPVGYYKSSIGSDLVFDEVKRKVGWESDETWVTEEIQRKSPLIFSSKTSLYNLENCKTVRLQVLTGNKIVGFTTIPKNADVQFFREKRTGTYCISGSAEKVSYYTKLDKESDYENNPPLEEEREDVLTDKSLLIPEWREIINYINSNPALTVEAKLKLLIKEWRGKFVYSTRYGLDEQNTGASREEVAAKIVNTSKGICNISATGFAILLRAVGIPSRVCGGYWNQGNGHGGSHMWLEYWDNGQWVQWNQK